MTRRPAAGCNTASKTPKVTTVEAARTRPTARDSVARSHLPSHWRACRPQDSPARPGRRNSPGWVPALEQDQEHQARDEMIAELAASGRDRRPEQAPGQSQEVEHGLERRRVVPESPGLETENRQGSEEGPLHPRTRAVGIRCRRTDSRTSPGAGRSGATRGRTRRGPPPRRSGHWRAERATPPGRDKIQRPTCVAGTIPKGCASRLNPAAAPLAARSLRRGARPYRAANQTAPRPKTVAAMSGRAIVAGKKNGREKMLTVVPSRAPRRSLNQSLPSE